MSDHYIPGNATAAEVVRTIDNDPKATEREKYLVEYLRNGGERQNMGYYPLGDFRRIGL